METNNTSNNIASNRPKIVAFVPIKFRSQRLENKNILPLGQYPLCWYIFNTLKQISLLDEVYVFCSDPQIKKYIPDDIKFLQRSAKLDNDHIQGIQIYTEFVKNVSADIYLLAHATSPFISHMSIKTGIEKILNDGYDSAFSVSKMQSYAWFRNKPVNYQLNNVIRTQELEPILIETSGFFLFKKEILVEHQQRIGTNPYQVIVNKIEAIDIDEVDDYQMAQNIIKSSNLHQITKNRNFQNSIKMIIMDFDGTLSDGKVYMTRESKIIKHYHTKDGLMIKEMAKKGYIIYICSGQGLDFFQRKAVSFGIKLHHNCSNKLKCMSHIVEDEGIELSNVAYIGDDINDLDLLKSVGLAGCPSDAVEKVSNICHFVSQYKGGDGAVREFLEYIDSVNDINDINGVNDVNDI